MELTELQIYRRLVLKLLVAILYRTLGPAGLDKQEVELVQKIEDYLEV